MANYASLKVVELKALLKERSLSEAGTKPELIARLVDYDSKQKESEPDVTEPEVTPAEATSGSKDSAQPSAPVEPATTNTTAETTTNSTTEATTDSTNNSTTTTGSTTDSTTDPTTDSTSTEQSEIDSAIAELKKKILRIKKFGKPEDAEEIERQIERIQKHGLTPLAKKDILRTVKPGPNTSIAKSASKKYNIPDDALAKRKARFS